MLTQGDGQDPAEKGQDEKRTLRRREPVSVEDWVAVPEWADGFVNGTDEI